MSRGRLGISFAEEFRWTFAVRPLDTFKCTVDGAPVPPGGSSAGVIKEIFDISERLGGESEGEGLHLHVKKLHELKL